MARDKKNLSNIDNSNLPDYPNGRIKDNTGAGDGTPVNEIVYGDHHEFFAKLMRLAALTYNGLPDNESNGHQLISALKAFPTKGSFNYDLTKSGNKILIGIKVGILQVNEVLWGKVNFDFGTETVLRGSDNQEKSITVQGGFKSGEYVRVVNTVSTINIIRIGDHISLDTMIAELLYLKAASTAEELAGSIITKATTPQGNMLAFAEWVNGPTSAASLATAIRNGLYPKEHFSIVENLGNDRVRNIGWTSGIDPGGGSSGNTFPVSGDFTQCQFFAKNDGATTYTVTMANAMDNPNYFVRIFLESQGNIDHDDNSYTPVFVPVSTTQFRFRIDESFSKVQSLKVHMEVVQIA